MVVVPSLEISLLEGICAILDLPIQALKQVRDTKQDIYLEDVTLALSWGAKIAKIKCLLNIPILQ